MQKKEKINVRRICYVLQRNLSTNVREGLRLFGQHRKSKYYKKYSNQTYFKNSLVLQPKSNMCATTDIVSKPNRMKQDGKKRQGKNQVLVLH